MKAPVRVSGLDDLDRRMARLAELTGLEGALRGAAEDVRAEARRTLAGYPSKDRSAVAASLEITQTAATEIAVGTPLAAGPELEFGTRGSAPMPFMSSALRAALPGLKLRLRTVVAAALRGASR